MIDIQNESKKMIEELVQGNATMREMMGEGLFAEQDESKEEEIPHEDENYGIKSVKLSAIAVPSKQTDSKPYYNDWKDDIENPYIVENDSIPFKSSSFDGEWNSD
uniref:Uncharacterized protein n=1 Tax=Euplotes harpa TaxID=151035 RepID=A0A7S3J514_9SPIT|mmetsp:Transcript_20490/g.23657  ORF Transcript_20490/g.23657 Transcript_20490/m.23657 type:complete len:105 (+) Transcript_20490:278-592(+)